MTKNIQPGLNNTWKNVRKYRERLLSGDEPVLEGLERSWQLLNIDYGNLIKRDEELSRNPLKAFLNYLDMGFYPPPEVILAVGSCFDEYFEHGGELELEDIFFPSARKKGVGNYSAIQRKEKLYEHFYFLTTAPTLRKVAQIDLAENMLVDLERTDLDADTFLRGYRRWKESKKKDTKLKIAERLPEIIKEESLDISEDLLEKIVMGIVEN